MITAEKLNKLYHEQDTNEDNRFVFLYSFFPVALGTRRVSLVPWFEFDYKKKLENYKNTRRRELMSSEERLIIKRLGLNAIELKPTYRALRFEIVPLDRYFLVKEGDEIENELRQMIHDKSTDMTKREGAVLDYPKCCVDEFLSDHAASITPDVRLQAQTKLWNEKGRAINPLSFYTWGFVPCKPNCEKAAERGRKILEKYKELDMELYDGYAAFLEYHVSRALNGNAEQLIERIEEVKSLPQFGPDFVTGFWQG